MIYFTMPIVWTFPNLIVHVSILIATKKYATNIINKCCSNNTTNFHPLSPQCHRGIRGILQNINELKEIINEHNLHVLMYVSYIVWL